MNSLRSQDWCGLDGEKAVLKVPDPRVSRGTELSSDHPQEGGWPISTFFSSVPTNKVRTLFVKLSHTVTARDRLRVITLGEP